MHDTLTSTNWRDFQQRYQGTYGWLVHNNKEIPVHIENVTDNMVTFRGLEGAEYFSYADRDVKFRFSPLRRRLVIGGKTHRLMLISRIPQRQWSRGICENNTRVTLLGAGRTQGLSVNSATMADILAGENLTEGKLQPTKKLSDVFGIASDVLWLYNRPIGTVAGDQIRLVEGAQIFAQEVSDTLRDIKSNYKVA
ncbi:MAG TPA: hypothetical protein VFM18_02870 [Methanosarcina sp.]|nr:hypothetical protein [Methanosarcina sp.]